MTWVRLDDGFPEHPKVAAAGPAAAWVHVCGLCYAGRQLTDGFVPASVAATLGPKTAIRRLVELGIWENGDGGYQIHDYLDYQPSRQEILELRAMKAKAGRLGGLKTQAKRQSGAKAGAQANDEHVLKQDQSPSPSPLPGPLSGSPRAEEENVVLSQTGDLDFELEMAKGRLLAAIGSCADNGTAGVLSSFGFPAAAWYAAAEELRAQGKQVRDRAAYACSLFKRWQEDARYGAMDAPDEPTRAHARGGGG